MDMMDDPCAWVCTGVLVDTRVAIAADESQRGHPREIFCEMTARTASASKSGCPGHTGSSVPVNRSNTAGRQERLDVAQVRSGTARRAPNVGRPAPPRCSGTACRRARTRARWDRRPAPCAPAASSRARETDLPAGVDAERDEDEQFGDDSRGEEQRSEAATKPSAREDAGDRDPGEEKAATPDRQRVVPWGVHDRRPAIGRAYEDDQQYECRRQEDQEAPKDEVATPHDVDADSREHCKRERRDGRREHRIHDELENRKPPEEIEDAELVDLEQDGGAHHDEQPGVQASRLDRPDIAASAAIPTERRTSS